MTVTTPADAADTERFVPKLIVPMVPTSVPSSLMIIPLPDAVIPVSPDPSPTKLAPVIIPVALTLSTRISGLSVNPAATVATPAVFANETVIFDRFVPSP